MAFVVSAGQLATVNRSVVPALPPMSVRLSDDLTADYAAIYRSQPQVRTVVGFLARNVAQLGLHHFRRVSDTDRVRLTDHPVARLFAQPNPRMTPYRLFQRLISDLAIYDVALWVKVMENGGVRGLVPIPPARFSPIGENWLEPDGFEIRRGGRDRLELDADRCVYFRGYHPDNPVTGCSPMEALRSLLIEEYEATATRQAMWRNGARMSGVISRPTDAPAWSPTARERFQSQWRASYTGSGTDAGGTPLLEDGMTWHNVGLDAQQAQYVESRKLTREEVCCAYWVPPPMVGILDHATYSNITQQHKMLYQDCLGPTIEAIAQEIELQVYPDLPGTDGVYCEFNIASKLQGSFEEQASAASSATGRPWMTANETRARFNLPTHPDGDGLVVPLNVLVGGMASPRDTAPPKAVKATRLDRPAGKAADLAPLDVEASHLEENLNAWCTAQASTLLAGLDGDALPSLDEAWGVAEAWDESLSQVIVRHAVRIAETAADDVLDLYNPDRSGWNADVLLPWLTTASRTYATAMNTSTRYLLTEGLSDVASWKTRVAGVLGDRASFVRLWSSRITTECAAFGGLDAAGPSGLTGKTWHAGHSGHEHLDGVRIELSATFPNSCRWPGDLRGGRAEAEGCTCRLTFD
ncbi:phage portal protein [Lentzea sp. JNUCC 0626]|uniref:phage portal protein n=1 Tax=Lentzea sp. JNUCC 0626 TaxID=3367513 RepID=UPI003749B512